VLVIEDKSHTKPRFTLVANCVEGNGARVGVSDNGKRMNKSAVKGKGPITYPTGQPFKSGKHVKPGTSVYVGLKRPTKLVHGQCESRNAD
jgi:hypothetical protein